MRLLLVEDDIDLCKAVVVHLKKEGYEVDLCHIGSSVSYYIENSAYDLIILDRMLPEIDGLKILEKIREQQNTTPVIIITALNGINDRVDGLDAGADDYLVKPFAVKELQARIRALLRRPRNIENLSTLKVEDIELNTNSFVASDGSQTISLSKKEGILLEYFLLNFNKILSREQILRRVWGPDNFVEDGNIDNYIYFVRRRLKALNTCLIIKTIHGIGYRIERNNND